MKEKLIVGIISILLLSLVSCHSDEPIGRWNDNIKLSEKDVTINAESTTLVIMTEGTWWWVNGIGLDDDWSYDISGTDTAQNVFLIEEDEFTIERKNGNEIHIFLTENQSDVERPLTISLQAGNYFDETKITQVES